MIWEYYKTTINIWSIESHLNILGRQGWELVGFNPDRLNETAYVIILKRPKK